TLTCGSIICGMGDLIMLTGPWSAVTLFRYFCKTAPPCFMPTVISMSLYGAMLIRYFFPINEMAQHWCLAYFDIVSGLVTFYDSGDTYDYESRDFCLATYENSVDDKDMMIKLFEIDNERDFRAVRDTYASCQGLNLGCQERREQIIKMQPFLYLSTVLAESYNLLKELQDYELEKCRDLMKSIS
ncbi:phospholipase-like protein, partial [Tanacetum coccineum]